MRELTTNLHEARKYVREMSVEATVAIGDDEWRLLGTVAEVVA